MSDFTSGSNCHIAKDFIHGKNFRCGHNVIIAEDCIVGDDVFLDHGVFLRPGTRILNNVKMGEFCGSGGGNMIGNNVNIRTRSSIATGTIVEDDAFIGPHVITNHTKNVTHRRPNVKHQILITRIGSGAIIGSNVWIAAGSHIPPLTIVGGGTAVTKPIEKPGVWGGNPAKFIAPVPPDYMFEISSEHYKFDQEFIDKYLPGAIEK